MNIKTLISTIVTATALMTTHAFANNVEASDAWARASAGMAGAGAIFLTLNNSGTQDDVLKSAATDVAKRIELHHHTMVNGVMEMRQVEGGIKVPAGKTVMLQPGGYHIMLMNLNAPLKKGASFPVTLTFSSGETQTLNVKVMSPASMGAGKMKMDGKKMPMGDKKMPMGQGSGY
jgi:hypothetical protein